MFIAHGEKVRKHAKWILGGILILLIPGFIALFTTTGGGRTRRDEVVLPKLAGKPVDATEFRRAREAVWTLMVLGSEKPPVRTEQMEYQITQEAIVRLLLLRKANELGIRVSESDVAEQVRRNPDQYRQYLAFINSRRVSESLFEEILHEQIVLGRLQGLIGATAKVTPQELEQLYMSLQEKIAIDLVEFSATNFTGTITLTNGEAQAYFEQNREAFRRPAQTKVRYAGFAIADAKKGIVVSDEEVKEYYERNQNRYMDTNNVPQALETVSAKIREELVASRADRQAADRATEFSVKLVPEEGKPRPDFAKLAAEAGATVKETGFFGLTDEVPGVNAGAQFNQMAFALHPKDNPVSDPVAGKDIYYVLEYIDSKPSEIPAFDEVKDKAAEQLKREREYEAAVKQGREMVVKVKQAVGAGKSFAAVCKELGLKTESPEPFSRMDEKVSLPAAARIYQVTLNMATNSVSDLIATVNGALFFQLKQRVPPEPKDFQRDKDDFLQRVLEQKRQTIFREWIGDLVRQERVDFGPAPKQPSPVETVPELETPATNAPASS